MKIPISKSQKKQLQEAIESGIFDTGIFQELKDLKPVKDEMKELIDHGIIDMRDEFCRNTKY